MFRAVRAGTLRGGRNGWRSVEPTVVAFDYRPGPITTLGIHVPALARPLLKRAFDILFALLALVVMLPVLLLIAVSIKLDSRGPIFFRVRRVGFRGRPLMMLKFRKMHDHAAGGPLTTGGDPRLTRVGAILTRCRLDELPQFWDVLRGRMSIVGPRPEDPAFVGLHVTAYERILSVRPGMTGLSQLAYADEQRILVPDDAVGDYVARILPQKIALDTMYAAVYNLRGDLSVLFWTAMAVLLRQQVAVHRVTGELTLRKRRAVPSRGVIV